VAVGQTDVEVSNLESRHQVDQALESDGVTKIVEEADAIGSIVRGRANGVEIGTDENEYRVIRIPITLKANVGAETGLKDVNYIMWSDNAVIDTMASYIRVTDRDTPIVVNVLSDGEGVAVIEETLGTGYMSTDGMEVSPDEVIMPGGICGWTQRPNWDCWEDVILRNEDVSQSCSTCAAALLVGANPVSVVACTWCAWDLYQDGVSGSGCSLCE